MDKYRYVVVCYDTCEKETQYISEPLAYLDALAFMQNKAIEQYRCFRDEDVSLLFEGDKAVLKSNKFEWVWEIIVNNCGYQNGILIPVKGGNLDVRVSSDDNYPGVDIEFVSYNDTGANPSRPRVVVEYPKDDNLRVLIWNNPEDEDYTHCIELGGAK